MREKHSQLPGSSELQDILGREAKRDLVPSKEGEHFVEFSAFQKLLEAYHSPFRLLTVGELSFEEAMLEEAEQQLEDLVRSITLADPTQAQLTALNNAYDYLAEEDEIQPVDYIFVFGSKQRFRIDKAIELFKAGTAPRLLISGNHTHYENGIEAEAESHKRYAIEQGIPEDRIIAETTSISLPDNVRSSLNLLDSLGLPFESFALVNSPFAQRRGWAYFNKFTPDSTRFIRVNAATSNAFSRSGWHRTFNSAKLVLNEYVKMRLGVLLNTA